jgi:IS30 family transposase
MNGLLRDYLPKHTHLDVHTAEHLTAVANEINNRPRKTLTWVTPGDLFDHQLMLALARAG